MRKMTTSKAGISLITHFEGCKLTAYKPVATEKHYTIGYGHYGADVTKGMKITQEQAEDLLKKDIAPIEKLLNGLNVNFRQHQFDALVSWIFNLGAGNFNGSTMKKYIVADKDDLDITDEMVKWKKAGGQVLTGLVKRRAEEANMFLGKIIYECVGDKAVRNDNHLIIL